MEKNKHYYWFKLKDDFFAQPYIKKLRKIAGGDTYVIIYQKILLLTIKTNGYLIFQGIEKTLDEELALILDEETDNVRITISFMKSNNLIEPTEDEREFLLPNMLSLIGSESESAKRVRAYRDRKKQGLLPSSQDNKTLQCNDDVTECNKNVTTEIDIDIDKDINIKESINTKEEGISNIYIVGQKPDSASLDPNNKIKFTDKKTVNTQENQINTDNKKENSEKLDNITNVTTIKNISKRNNNATIYDEIIDYLNLKCSSKYKSTTPATKTIIAARLKEGFKLDEFKTVIDKKTDEWLNDPKMCIYLRPATLFGTKFESYLNQKTSNRNISERTLKNFIVNQEVKKIIEEEL
jgi:uncharacterized phage protein (TIGR02220 family)/predicted phage replisome organizer